MIFYTATLRLGHFNWIQLNEIKQEASVQGHAMKGLYNPGLLQMEDMMAGRGYNVYKGQTLSLLLDLGIFKQSV